MSRFDYRGYTIRRGVNATWTVIDPCGKIVAFNQPELEDCYHYVDCEIDGNRPRNAAMTSPPHG